jgi:toxin CcdB
MAQYDVYANPTPGTGFPYLVDLQSAQLDRLPTRLVMPLQRLPRAPEGLPRRLVQPVQVKGEELYLAAHQCAALPVRSLRKPVASLNAQAAQVLDALDAVISGV